PVPPLRGRPRPPAPVSLDPRRRVADAGATAPTGGTPMHVSALLEFDAVPVDSADTVHVLLDVTAPEQPGADRPPATLQVVLDRSGSMAGERLEGAIRALLSLVDRLDPTDHFGLVTFDGAARVEVAAAPLT